MDLIIASTNKGKIREIKNIMKGLPVKIKSLLDFTNPPNIRESGKTFRENAAKKAMVIAKKFKKLTLADDSGLEVNYLKGAPGVRSARFVRPPVTSKKLCRKLLKKLDGVPMGAREAGFVCIAAIATPDGGISFAKGICEGKIAFKMHGKNGFGYDPVFIPEGYKKTFGELPAAVKEKLSHRGKAMRRAKKLLFRLISEYDIL